MLQLLPYLAAGFSIAYYAGKLYDRWHIRRTALDRSTVEVAKLRRAIERLEPKAREDRMLLAFVLGLGGAGIAMVLIVLMGVVG